MMKTRALKTILLTVGLMAPFTLLTSTVSASRSSSYSSGGHHGSSHNSYGSYSRGHGSSSYYGSSRRGYSHSNSYYPSYRHYPSHGYSHSRSYYSRPSYSISIGTGYYGGYYGAYYSSLPFGYSSCVVGGLTYYRHGGNYYRPYNTGYVLVSNPYVVRRATTASTSRVSGKYDAYPRIWVSGKEHIIDEGETFCITSSGLVWADLPNGSMATSLPTHASSVWYKEVEYYEAGGLYFQRVPEGYLIVQPPWEKEF